MGGRTLRRIVGPSLPVEYGLSLVEAFPPGLVVFRERDVRENRVAPDHLVGVQVGLFVGARHHAEVTRFRIDGPQAAVRPRMQPGDVVADRPDLPARHRARRDQHREIGLAAGGGKGAGEVMRLAGRILDADDQHVLGEPAFVARLPARDPQRVAFLAEQRVAAVARAEALDLERLREMHDEAPLGIELADRVQALHEHAVLGDARERRRTHAGHQLHVRGDVGAVGDLDAAARIRRIDGAHAIRNDVHRPAAHAALEQRVHLPARFGGRHPVIVRAGVVALLGADEGQVLDAGDVRRIGAVQVAAGKALGIELHQVARGDHLADEFAVLGLGPVTPVNLVRDACARRPGEPSASGFRVRERERPCGRVRLPSEPQRNQFRI